MSVTTEEWRPIPGHPSYEASSLGRIRSFKHKGEPKILSPGHGNGYLKVQMCQGGRPVSATVNRLVCLAFHGAPPSVEYESAHDDGTRTNNIPSNLSWKTPKANAADRLRHGTHTRGARNGRAILTEQDAAFVRLVHVRGGRFVRPGNTPLLARILGVSHATVRSVANNASWRTD